jgi:hypothetical protein
MHSLEIPDQDTHNGSPGGVSRRCRPRSTPGRKSPIGATQQRAEWQPAKGALNHALQRCAKVSLVGSPIRKSSVQTGEQYVRDHLCLRTEPATNDVTDYGVKKAVENLPQPRSGQVLCGGSIITRSRTSTDADEAAHGTREPRGVRSKGA